MAGDVRVLNFRGHFDFLHRNLGSTLGADLSYRELVKYVQGVDAGTNMLDGFHEWLVRRLGAGRSLYWSALVTYDALGVEPAHHSTDLPGDWQQRVEDADSDLVEHLFEVLDGFLAERWAEPKP
ncbi:MAG: hypothetical protein GY745_17540 [Actinomycetia bacterium]|nr:hypothetical protein [Actinomycetes bacterium]MCP4086835.1 hypothetical protein [Actinomycetes bacterium]